MLFISSFGFSQAPTGKIQQYLNDNRGKYNLTSQDIQEWFVESEASSTNTGINNYYIKQKYQGIELFNSVSNIWVKNNEVINGGQGLISNVSSKINTTTATLSVLDGLNSALTLLEIHDSGNHQIIETIDVRNYKISNGNLDDPITAKLVYQLTEDNHLRLAWDFTIDIVGHNHMWSVRIDATNGAVLEKNDMVISCNFEAKKPSSGSTLRSNLFTRSFFKNNSTSILDVQAGNYNVIPFNYESPNHSPRVLISSPSDATASPYGWHDTNGVVGNEYTSTRGNNVYAQEDNDGNDGTGATASGGLTLTFNFPYNGTSSQPSSYTNAALTNLFYMNNMMHDIWYQYGFNEANGNFQQNNYGRGGTVTAFGDAVFGDGQDGATASPQNINNANFSTPADGQRPRMQMYLWNVAPPIEPVTVNTPLDIAGSRVANDNVFSPGHIDIPIAPAIIQSDLVLFDDGVGPDTADACTAPINSAAMNGHIVVIRRGDCTFVSKVKLAQNAGATAVIIVNNVTGTVNMAGADATITIPAVSMDQAIGDPIIARMQTESVNATIQLAGIPFVNADGDFDNGVIAHEYGHGISTRLTGGPSNSSCLQNGEQAGEGWSDWFALMMQLKAGDTGTASRGIGTFVVSEPTSGGGIRNFPYSTDMNINPLTFSASNDTESHNRGEFMTAVLWDLTWAYIQKYGMDPNIYTGTGGNNKVMKLVIDGLKLQPCGPSFVDFRTALIAADQATTGGHDYCLITEVFRRRGMGLNASSGSSSNATDQVENFTAFPPGSNCTLSADYFENEELFRVYPNPTNGSINIRINNYNGKASIKVVDINGRVVLENNSTDFNIEKSINLSHLSAGMYIIKVSADSLNFTEKIIKK